LRAQKLVLRGVDLVSTGVTQLLLEQIPGFVVILLEQSILMTGQMVGDEPWYCY